LRLPVRGVGEPVVADEPGHHDLLAGLEGDRAGGGVVLQRLALDEASTWLSDASLVLFR